MYPFRVALFTCIISAAVDIVFAEKHIITFDNQCGYGSPRLIQKGNTLSTGEPFTSDGPFSSAIAYLQTGNCLLNGEGCTTVEMTLTNPTCPGCGSSTDISLIPPLAYSIPIAFSYQGACQGQGATCASADCKDAFFAPDDNHVQVQCEDNDANLLITFCGGSGTNAVTSSNIQPASSASQVLTRSTTSTVSPAVKGLPVSTILSNTKAASPSTTSSASTSSLNSNTPQCARNGSRKRARSSSQATSPAVQARSPRPTRMHSHRRRSNSWHA